MKTISTTSLTLAAAIATTLSTSASVTNAASYKAVCVFDELQCGGDIKLREYTPDASCTKGECAAITAGGVTTFSALPTCATDVMKDVSAHLAGSFVIAQVYAVANSTNSSSSNNDTASGAAPSNSAGKCAGAFTKAIAVVADGKCYPSSDGTASFAVTIGADKSATWRQYTDAKCATTATTVEFKPTELDGSVCVLDSIRATAVIKDKASASATAAPSASSTSAAVSVRGSAIGLLFSVAVAVVSVSL